MHPLHNPLSSTFLSFLLLPLTNAYQNNPRQISAKKAPTPICNTRNLPEANTNVDFVSNDITSTCIAQFRATCLYVPGHSASVEVPDLDPNQLDVSESYLCGQGLSTVLPKITPAVCYCACRCTNQEENIDQSTPDQEGNIDQFPPNQEEQQVQEEERCLEDYGNPASCVSLVLSMSVSSAASVSTSAWSNYTATATATGSAPASSSSSVRGLGPHEGFERKRRV